jgi:hypothetical protein
MSFKKNKYVVARKAISEELANFLFNYFLMKRQVAKTLFETKSIAPSEKMHGTWKEQQVPNTYAHYSDIAMETLLLRLKPLMEKHTGVKLLENYSYARIYKNGDVLKRHKDRFSCEFSTTLNLGGDKWPIYLNSNPAEGFDVIKKEGHNEVKYYSASNSKGIEINLNPGDMLIYRGDLLEHWRDKFEGKDCGQVFLHYTNASTPGAHDNIFDTRPHLGLPEFFKNPLAKR